jgi:hypothetical protein
MGCGGNISLIEILSSSFFDTIIDCGVKSAELVMLEEKWTGIGCDAWAEPYRQGLKCLARVRPWF